MASRKSGGPTVLDEQQSGGRAGLQVVGDATYVGDTDADRGRLGDLLRWWIGLFAFEREAEQRTDDGTEYLIALFFTEIAEFEGDEIAVVLLGDEQGVEDPDRVQRRSLLEPVDDVSSELVEGVELEHEQLYRTEHGHLSSSSTGCDGGPRSQSSAGSCHIDGTSVPPSTVNL